MANPVPVSCPQDTWTLVARNVTAGVVKKLSNSPSMYLETYRMTGDAAPLDTDLREGVPMFANSWGEIIDAAAAIDVYVMARGNDGYVRVDLP